MQKLKSEDLKVIGYLKEILNKMDIDVDKIILFGSRARGKATVESDYDFIIVVNNDLDLKDKRKLIRNIRKAMAKKLIPIDIFIKSKREFDKYKDIVGTIVFSANKEGIKV